MEDAKKELAEAQRRQARSTARTLIVLTILAFVLAIGGIVPLMGLPGALMLDFFRSLFHVFLPYANQWCHLHPDTLIYMGFFVTLLWPFSIPIGYGIARSCTRLRKSDQTLLWLGIMFLWGMLLSVGFCIHGTHMSACMQWPGQPPPSCGEYK